MTREAKPAHRLPFVLLLAGVLAVGGCSSTAGNSGVADEPTPYYDVAGERVAPEEPAPAERDLPTRLTVGDAVHEALENNRSVQLSRIGIAIGRTGEKEALSAMIPRLDWRGSFSRRDTPPEINTGGSTITIGQKDLFNSDFTVSFPLFGFGRFFYAWRAAQLNRERSEADRDTAESDIAAAVVAACYDLLENAQQIGVARSDEEAFAQQVKDSQALLDAGRVTRSALLEAQVEFDRARRTRERLESELPIRRMILNQLLGRPVHTEIEVVDDPVLTAPSQDVDVYEAEAVVVRPEMRSLRLELEAARRTEQAVLGGELPLLSGAVGYHQDDNAFSSPNDYASIQLGLDVPIFTGGGRTARIRRARYQTDLVRVRMNEIEESIRTEVRNTWNLADQSFQDIEVARLSIERAQESLRIQREKFNSGRATSREVLDSTSLLTSARFAYVRSIYSYNIALQELHRARGGDPVRSPVPGIRTEPQPEPAPEPEPDAQPVPGAEATEGQ